MLLEVDSLSKSFFDGDRALPVLQGVTFALEPGELLAITGPSGSGKSTLLHLVAGLDRPTEGTVRFRDRRVDVLSDADACAFRRRKLGFVFQSFHLLPALTAAENVALPLLLDGERPAEATRRAHALLDEMGLAERREFLPSRLSGGERQRVAIARALAANPELLLADEPTGNLDGASGRLVLDALTAAARRRGAGVLLVTHDEAAAARATRTIRLGAHSAVIARRMSTVDASLPG